ncbi:MAG: Sulfate permease, Trk-type [uncultured Campylobacterales bacterium]|uniref:Sulfate permease, Trk-type n=1 Tax=uncultured Campylobacterales bacterium TaxID=352960 RepID=A0A6S6T791_9BACT|nr:MAG: Sulfate permease, Trk-type [uncultured Campylobacterales bacterium]
MDIFSEWRIILTLLIFICTFLTLFFTRISPARVFLASVVLLFITGILNTTEFLSGFNSSAVVTVGLLYIVVAGVEQTGGLSWLTKYVLGNPKSYFRAQLRLMLPTSFLSAFLNNTPVVALLIPIVQKWSSRINIKPSKLLIPLSYASILGGLCTLIGTSTNLVVNGLYQDRYGNSGFEIFEIAKVGIPVAIVGIIFILLLSFLLPNRTSFKKIEKSSRVYQLEMYVPKKSSLIGKTFEESGLTHLAEGGKLEMLIRNSEKSFEIALDDTIKEDDHFIFSGNIGYIQILSLNKGLRKATTKFSTLNFPRQDRILVEVVISKKFPFAGKFIDRLKFRRLYNARALSAAQDGESVLSGRYMMLHPGDTILVEAHSEFLLKQKYNRDFYILNSSENELSRESIEKAPVALGILLGMVALAGFGIFSMFKAALIAASLMIIAGCCSIPSLYKSIDWKVLVTIASALGLGLALEKTGIASLISTGVLEFAGNNPWIILILVYFITSFFTEIITNNAAAALTFPLVMNMVDQLGVNPIPFVMCIMVSASASFITPIGYQTNLMIYGPGGYRFSDYLRIGVPLDIVVAITTICLAPLIWPF